MAWQKLFIGSLLVAILGIAILSLVSHNLNIDLNRTFVQKLKSQVRFLGGYLVVGKDDGRESAKTTVEPAQEDRAKEVFTAGELAKYTGLDGYSVYVAFIGKIYNVDAGHKHYGPGGGYAFFAGTYQWQKFKIYGEDQLLQNSRYFKVRMPAEHLSLEIFLMKDWWTKCWA